MDYINTVELLIERFKESESFSRKELFDFYRAAEPDLKEATFRWRIHDLKQKNVIVQLSKQFFSLNQKHHFYPIVDENEREIFDKIEKQFPFLRKCIWSTRSILEFNMNIPVRFCTIVEVEKEAVSSVFYFLRDIGEKDVFIQPGEKEMEYYVSELYSSIIVQSLTTKSPVHKVKGITTISIEKMLVDLYCEKIVFVAYQGSELVHIINTAYDKYVIDFTKLFSYAKRRGKEKELRRFLLEKTNVPPILLTN